MEVDVFVKISWNLRKLVVFALAVIALLSGAIVPVSPVRATPGSGVTGTLIASGTLLEAVPAKFKTETGNVQVDVAKTMLIKYTIAPGGVFGWHEHGGPLWAMVDSGTLTFYHGDDPSCTGVEYPAGTTFMDPGNYTHNARNEGTKNAVVYVVYMLPQGGAARHDVSNPGNCLFEED
jgi:quercetin dioxygenase-like cupin family protein